METKKCVECKSEIPADASRCAHCRASQPTARNLAYWLLAAVLTVGVLWWSGFIEAWTNFNHASDELIKTIDSK